MGVRKIRNYRWWLLLLLVSATTINYLDRQILGLLKPLLEMEFQWSETDFAHIVMAFTGAYALGLVSWGWLIDRIGIRLGYSLSVISWSVMGILHAVARTAWGFGLARFGLGLTESGNVPAGMKTIAEWFPRKERALATGFFNAGTSVGIILALVLVPWIVSRYGWQEVFVITGCLGFMWLIVWLIVYRSPARQKRLTEEEYELITSGDGEQTGESEAGIKWIKLFSMPQTWAFITGKLLLDPVYWFFMFWLPSYFSSVFHLDMTRLSVELAVIYIATIVGSIGGGYASSWLIGRGWPALKARKTVLLIFAVMELSIIFARFVTELWGVVVILSFALAVHQGWSTNVFTLVCDLFPRKVVASVTGIGAMSGAVGGMIFPLLVGFILDKYKAAGDVTSGYHLLFLICSVMYLIAWVIIHLLTRKATASATR